MPCRVLGRDRLRQSGSSERVLSLETNYNIYLATSATHVGGPGGPVNRGRRVEEHWEGAPAP
jgi:hypothetical protein